MSKSLMFNNQAHEPIYEIVFETALKNLAEKDKADGLEGRKVCIVMDSNTSHLYGEKGTKGVRACICEGDFLPVSGRRAS